MRNGTFGELGAFLVAPPLYSIFFKKKIALFLLLASRVSVIESTMPYLSLLITEKIYWDFKSYGLSCE